MNTLGSAFLELNVGYQKHAFAHKSDISDQIRAQLGLSWVPLGYISCKYCIQNMHYGALGGQPERLVLQQYYK